MSSLWLVDDQSTSELMKYFYSNLAKSTTQTPVTKAFALRQAQLSLMQAKISTNKQVTDLRAGGITPEQIAGTLTKVKRTQDNFSHPYYWAPFILIENGL